MKILPIFFLAALVGCYGDESCIDEKAESCVLGLLTSIKDDTDAEVHETCQELQTSIECLESSVESCAEGELNAEIKRGLDTLKMLRNESCQMYALPPEKQIELEQCLEANGDYIFECMSEGTAAAMELLGDEDVENVDENILKCGLYRFLTKCYVDRIEYKCGAEAAELARAEFTDMPDDFEEACEAVGDADVPEIRQLGEDKRKK